MSIFAGFKRNRRSQKLLGFAALCLLCGAVAAVHTFASAERIRGEEAAAKGEPGASAEALAELAQQPHLLFLESSGDTYRRVAIAPLDPAGEVLETDLWCQRVYFAGGRGLCLGKDAYKGGAFIFDSHFQFVQDLNASGIASRVRISSDGRFGAFTVFVQGHSYSEGGFSTRTKIVDMETGKSILDDLEDLDVRRGGSRIESPDRNFWGVTFVSGGTSFYATMSTGGKTYLIQGDFITRQAAVLRENVECPSVSPDGTRIVFKKRVSEGLSGVTWELHLLQLDTMEEISLGEQRNVDDQAEWLDNDHVVYFLHDDGPPASIRPDLWVASMDGSPPQVLRQGAFSPAAVR
ncbi:hypothetical protein AYO38_03475 [bacterium SCGC AG-212-C10]|nr:hypothetical protein AYO38_03475 [bacterium SCGC AG-212-C10]